MAQVHERVYGEATTVDFELATLAGDDLKIDATFVAGDVTISKDEGAEANVATLPTDRGTGYSQPLSVAEIQCQRAIIHFRDQSVPQVWLARSIVVETKNHPLAQHRDTGLIDVGVAQSGGANTITLAATAPTKIDPGAVIVLKGGTGSPALGVVDNYNGTTKQAVMTSAWIVVPNATTVYEVSVGPADVNLSTATIQAVSGPVGSVTGSVGSVVGAVGSVLGSVGSVAAGGITAASIATDALTAVKIATDAITKITAGILNAIAASYNAGGSVGAQINSGAASGDPMTAIVPGAYPTGTAGHKIGTYMDATIASRSSHNAADVRIEIDTNSSSLALLQSYTDTLKAQLALVKAQTDLLAFTGTDVKATLDGESVTTLGGTQVEITAADKTVLINALLDATVVGHVGLNTVGGALLSRLRWNQVGTTVTVQTADGLTNLFQLALTVDATSGAITGVTPL